MVDIRERAFAMMNDAAQGKNISDEYNSLTPQQQRLALTAMENLQRNQRTMGLFGNVELTDFNHDGFLDDVKTRMANGTRRDVYDPPHDYHPRLKR